MTSCIHIRTYPSLNLSFEAPPTFNFGAKPSYNSCVLSGYSGSLSIPLTCVDRSPGNLATLTPIRRAYSFRCLLALLSLALSNYSSASIRHTSLALYSVFRKHRHHHFSLDPIKHHSGTSAYTSQVYTPCSDDPFKRLFPSADQGPVGSYSDSESAVESTSMHPGTRSSCCLHLCVGDYTPLPANTGQPPSWLAKLRDAYAKQYCMPSTFGTTSRYTQTMLCESELRD